MASRGSDFARLVLGAMLAQGCAGSSSPSSGDDGPPASAVPRPYTGRVVAEVLVEFPEGYLASLGESDRQAFVDAGLPIDDLRNGLVYPRMPLPGRWVQVGDRFYMTDEGGYFRVPDVPEGAAIVAIHRDTQDTREADFPLDAAGFDLPDDAGAPDYVIAYDVPSPGPMNAPMEDEAPASAASSHFSSALTPDGCEERCDANDSAAVANASPGCCADYDGNLGDGLPRFRNQKSANPAADEACNAKALQNFWLSTCFRWSVGPLGVACLNESAFQCIIQPGAGEPAAACKRGTASQCAGPEDCGIGTKCIAGRCMYPNCWFNHKYRNCQNMKSDEFDVTPQLVRVAPGQKVDIEVFNNTPANETRVLGMGDGKGTLELAAGSGGAVAADGSSRRLLHYDDTARKHFERMHLTYTAPESSSCFPTPVTLAFEANGRIKVVVILVKGSAGALTAALTTASVSSAAETCPTSCAPSGALGDVLSISCVVSEWARGDAIAPGTGLVDGVMYYGDDSETIVGQGGVLDDSTFGFVADCSGGGGACSRAMQVGTSLCSGLTTSDPRLRITRLDNLLVDSLYVDGVHARPGGGLVLASRPYREFAYTLDFDMYTYFWADRDATVRGSCDTFTFDLTLRRGWNSIHQDRFTFKTSPVSEDARFWFYNPLTAAP